MQITEDRLLNGRVVIYQPKDGYRVAVDPVLLAAAVPAREGERVLDLGVGTGAISLCLEARVPKLEIRGIDTNTKYLELANKSVRRNEWVKYIDLHFGDVRKPPRALEQGSFDWVVANPPYYKLEDYSQSPDAGKTAAHAAEGDMADWVKCARHYLKPEGQFILIYPADGLETLSAALKEQFSHVTTCQILPKSGQKAKRVLVAAKNGAEIGKIWPESLILHLEDGAYTPEARAILWDMKGIGLE